MKIGVLTSSRADYGIYQPLLEIIKDDAFFDLEIIAFGTHLSRNHGYTIDEITKDNYKIIHQISSLIANDNQEAITTSYGLTVIKFAEFYNQNKFDVILCLGDRFEMCAAVQAGIPFGIKFVHFYGGETTLGAIDNVYRHQITIASTLHFTATDLFKEKVSALIGTTDNVYSVGSLSLNNIKEFIPIQRDLFFEKHQIPDEDFALVTFHPETVLVEENWQNADEMKEALIEVSKKLFVIITLPNADTQGSVYRDAMQELKLKNPHRFLLIENFGKINYFTAMYYSKILIGNTSSGIVEAASFKKYVVNVGNRQLGRLQSKNILNCDFHNQNIITAVDNAVSFGEYLGDNVYFKSNAVQSIIKILKL